MTSRYYCLASVAFSGLLLVACSPARDQGTATPGTTGAAPMPAIAPAPSVPVSSPADAAWRGVVEAGKRQGTVTVYSFSFIGELGFAFQKAMKEKYGISTEIVSGSGPALQERLKTERRSGRMVADVVEGSGTNKVNMKLDGLSQPFGDLPVLREKDVWFFNPVADPEGHIVYHSPTIQVNWVNKNLVKQDEEPRSFRDLLDPKWKGKIVAYDPALIQTLDQWYAVFHKRGILSQDYFRALGKQDVIRAYPAARAAEILARGDARVWLLGSQGEAGRFVLQGAPIKPMDGPEEGTPAFSRGMILVSGAPHPEAGRVFMNWAVSQEGQQILGRVGQLGIIRKDIPDPTPEGARFKTGKLTVYTLEDLEEGAKAFRERQVSKLWEITSK